MDANNEEAVLGEFLVLGECGSLDFNLKGSSSLGEVLEGDLRDASRRGQMDRIVRSGQKRWEASMVLGSHVRVCIMVGTTCGWLTGKTLQ